MTSDLCSRIAAHKEGSAPGFTKRYDVKRLVHVEFHDTMEAAIAREKSLKAWRREWKLALIEKTNPDWHDLFEDMCGPT